MILTVFVTVSIACNVSELAWLNNGGVSIEGTVAIYLCNSGYTLIGSESRTCRNESWSHSEPPFCQSMYNTVMYVIQLQFL